jgi:hypothetical protein
MKLIKQLNEALSRNDQLKAAFSKALDAAVAKYADDFDGDKADKAREALLTKFNPNLTKGEMTAMLKNLGIGKEGTMTSDQIVQFMLNQANRFDAEMSRAK